MLFIFDMGGVVTTNFGENNEMYSYLGLERSRFFDICQKEKSADGSDFNIDFLLGKGKISVEEFWREFNRRVKALGLAVPEVNNDLYRLFFHPELKMETVELIKELRAKKHRVVCGTNTIQSHWENHMERGDYALFDQTYASNKIGLLKPDPKFWEVIMMAEGYEPEQTYFTDDRMDNIEVAAGLGIKAVQFTTAEAVRKGWGI
nr:HAD-IA family hydrolase [uncultured Treponema sp.]